MRLIAAFFLAAIEAISFFVLKDIRSYWYFIVAAVFNLICIMVLPSVRNTNFISDLQKICFANLLIQYVGWVLYECYFSPVAYNAMIYALDAALIVRLIWIDDDRDTTAYFDVRGLCSVDIASMGKNTKSEARKC